MTSDITIEQILFEALCPFMEITEPGAKCFHKRFVKPDVLYIFLYIGGHVWLLLLLYLNSLGNPSEDRQQIVDAIV